MMKSMMKSMMFVCGNVAASSGEEDAQSLGQSLSRVEPGDWWKHVLHPRCSNSAVMMHN